MTSTNTAFASVEPPTRLADDLIDQLVAFRPGEVVEVETVLGTSTATMAEVLVIDEGGVGFSRGIIPVFWVVIRDQLRRATPAVPWIAGVFTAVGRAYRLRELTVDEAARVQKALAALAG
jgi:hypothetical protein